MPDPLPSEVVARLKSDPTAAVAAALIVAGSFPDLVSWAMRAFGGRDGAPAGEVKANGAGPTNGDAKDGDGAKKRARGHSRHTLREVAGQRDEALLALMRANPAARLTEIIRLNGRPLAQVRGAETGGMDRAPTVGSATR
jgi:hypothetical protein